MTRKNSLVGSAALCGAAAMAALFFLPFRGLRPALLAGLGAALALALPSYWSLSWAMDRSDRVFYACFAGGVLFRLAGLALAALWIYRGARLPLAAALLSMTGGMFLLSMIEAYLIQRQVRP